MLSFKKIIENMVENECENFVWNKSEKIATVSNVTFEKMDSETIRFEATVKVEYTEYTFGGIVTDMGRVFVGSILREGMRCTEKDEKGDWITESAKPFSELVYGEALTKYAF